ncbi:hypothetical protein H4218_003582 [Coemansia sp. IMI 209128]|nr:hypothetical protein GGI06_000044 [Coemansia sp. S85]KAJ2416365.1 hypothetical protein GGI10_001027 [Coemansia sp. RSA 2530]KAJ2697964.1 hypothetical protein H4218_003582 [Coemansia sp. IMI 209128]
MKTVKILVRSPSVSTPDNFSVHVGLEQSVEDIKRSIEASHKASPLARDMRIIWKGRVLEDADLVKSIYADEEAPEAQTVHFVLNSPVSVASASKRLASRSHTESPLAAPSAKPRERSAHADSGAGCPKEQSAPRPNVVPLGSQFQYVLVDGVPYLRVLQPVGSTQAGAYGVQHLSAALTGDNSGEMQTLERLNGHLEMRNRMLQELEETSVRLERLMALNRTRDRGQREGVRARQEGNNGFEIVVNWDTLAGHVRNFDLGAFCSGLWMRFRLLLLAVIVFHNASFGRMLALAVAVCCFFAFRSPWAQQQLEWLNQHNNYIDLQAQGDAADGRGRRQFTAWETSKALAIALFTSLIPSEPFQPPVAEE